MYVCLRGCPRMVYLIKQRRGELDVAGAGAATNASDQWTGPDISGGDATVEQRRRVNA